MSHAPWEPEPTGEGLMAPQRRPPKNVSAAFPGEGARRGGPRLRLQLQDFSAPTLSAAAAPIVAATASTSAEPAAKPKLIQRFVTQGAVVGLKHYFGTTLRVVIVRNASLLWQPQFLLQPKVAIAGLAAVVATAATFFFTGSDTKVADQLGAAPAWAPPTIEAPDWNTVAQPVTTVPVESPLPAMPTSTDAHSTVATEGEAPAWTPASALPTTATTPSAIPNYPTTEIPNVAGVDTVPAANANRQATTPREPEVVATRPETPRPYPTTFAPEKPPQARITGNVTVLPGEPTP
ncbi:MAG: hypothetical protein KF708_03005 [Pirellulales bacterium]|nr:hypothetical protein [Pirellulales bacterium]